LNGKLRLFVGVVLVAAGGVLLLSCGEEGTTNAPCTNCDYWEKAFGRSGRYPAACPTDPTLIAFSDTLDPAGSAGPEEVFYHIWVAKLADTTTYFQITSGRTFDVRPVWSPDGTELAFERGEEGARDIFVVDVMDLENPGEPVRFTDNSVLEESNTDAAWVTVNGVEQWISFSNSTNGGGDLDIVRMPYPGPGEPVWVTADPSDYAANQNGVLGFIFKDKQSDSNGSNLVVFSSPDRTPVGDIYVVARSEEEEDTSQVHALVYINGKSSGDYSPVLFRYRPIQDSIMVQGQLGGYCSRARLDFFGMLPDTLNTVILDFVHTHGTLAVTSRPDGVNDVYVGTIEWSILQGSEGDSVVVDTVWVKKDEKTPPYDPEGEPRYAYYTCIKADTNLVYAGNAYGPCSDTLEVEVFPGETAWVTLVCGGGSIVTAGPAGLASGRRMPVLGQTQEPYSLWVVNVDTEELYLIAEMDSPISNPALSPDGRYIAYIVGEGTERQLMVSGDITEYIAGTGTIETKAIGLPGWSKDIECFRFPGRVSWISGADRRVVVSLSACGGGDLAEDYEIWIGDLSRFLD
jgi:hypothetical protein